ncbi:Pfam:PGAM [Seminavis robusta]|uniref:Pfam:PGAM n=1 Tax=Seminavis robusta TaxID=568900 RepID=A0A9N8HRH0_9STRA|nr:Pfam:PGAM [Seminavis robusta]|eukprot:Sro1568_g283050.1 Pfam:PGAM (597) ;mRNA; r:9191-11311
MAMRKGISRRRKMFPRGYLLVALALGCPLQPSDAFLLHQNHQPIASLLPKLPQRHHSGGYCNASTGDNEEARPLLERRQLLQSAVLLSSCLFRPRSANARGLVQFPVDSSAPLANTYHFMRVGDTLLEKDDIWTTNPLFLTNREAALTPTGMEQIQAASVQLEQTQQTPTVIKYSLAASCLDTAQIVGDILNLGTDRIIPEFTFLDPRGIGQWDMYRYSTTLPAIWALDAMEAGPEGNGGRPPQNTDGTPNETLADQVVRLRQLMSILETLYSGETILVIFPDGTGPALLSAMIAGIPLNRVHELEYVPGELRMDITQVRTLQLWKERTENNNAAAGYQQTLANGKEELARLRATATSETLSLKDQNVEAERKEIERNYQKEQQAKQKKKEQEEAKKQKLRDDVREEQEAKRQQLRDEQEARRLERQQGEGSIDDSLMSTTTSPSIAAGAAFGVVGLAGMLASPSSGSDDNRGTANAGSGDPSGDPSSEAKLVATITETKPRGDESDELSSDVLVPISEASLSADSPRLEAPLPMVPDVKPTREDKIRAAEEAMEEFLNQDDGAEDWLLTLSQLAGEDDNVDDEQDPSDVDGRGAL